MPPLEIRGQPRHFGFDRAGSGNERGAGEHAESHLYQPTPKDDGDDAPPACAQRDADTDLTRASRHDDEIVPGGSLSV